MCCTAMGTRQSEQGSLWVASAAAKVAWHPLYTRLNALLDVASIVVPCASSMRR